MSNQEKWLNNTVLLIAFLVLPMLVGCSQGMALKPGATSLDTHTKSVAFFTLVVKNDFKPDYGAAPCFMWVKSSKSETVQFQLEGDWQGNGAPMLFYWMDTSEFPVSLGLEPGKYTIGLVRGGGSNIALTWGFGFPLNTEFDLPPNSVVYLGHVVMTNREREGDEERSGSMIPLIDQSLSGYSGGTMDISVTDQSSEDIPKFVAKYPCLKGLTIKTAIMTKK